MTCACGAARVGVEGECGRCRADKDRARREELGLRKGQRKTRCEPTKHMRRRLVLAEPRDRADAPRCRADCADGPRPCPWVGCKYNLYLDVNPETGTIKFNFPDKEVWELEESCALDVAAQGGRTLEDAGRLVAVTRERVRQIEVRAAKKMRRRMREVA